MVDLTLDDSPPPPRRANSNATARLDENRKALSDEALPEAEWMEKEFTSTAIRVPTPVLKEKAVLHPSEANIALVSAVPSVRVGAIAPKSSTFNLSPPTKKVKRIIIPPAVPTRAQRSKNVVPEFEIEENPMDTIEEVGIDMHRLLDE